MNNSNLIAPMVNTQVTASEERRDAHSQHLKRGLAWLSLACGRGAIRLWLSVAVLLPTTLHVLGAEKPGTVPWFRAEGNVALRMLDETAQPIYTGAAEFCFLYTNSTWQVDAVDKGSGPGTDTCMSCKLVPEGIRYFIFEPTTQKTNKTTVAGFTLPFKHPPFDRGYFAPCWLTLAPNPALPIVGPHEIRRFLWTDRMDDPHNRGTFSATYLEAPGSFLSSLSITNDGMLLQMDRDEPKRYPAPYAAGFLETQYEVLATTNVGGLVFPLRSVFRRFSPNFDSKEPRLLVSTEFTLEIRRIELLQPGSAPKSLFESPKELFAMDKRRPGLAKGKALNYIVTHDNWTSITNKGGAGPR